MAIEQTDISGEEITAPTATVDKMTIKSLNVPTSPTSPGIEGQIEWDADYLYTCVEDNLWARTAHSTDWGEL